MNAASLAFVALLSAPLLAQADWGRLAPVNSPGALSDHVMVHDARGALVFGGTDGTGATNATWRFDGRNWSGVSTTVSPAVRLRHSGAYDRARGRFVIFGGSTSLTGGLRDDTWEFDGTNWKQISPQNKPSARNDHSMCYDSTSRRVLLFGGRTAAGDVNDTWAWDGSNWTQITTKTSPPARRDHSMVYDSVRGMVTMYGGFYSSFSLYGDTWEFDGTDWIRRAPTVSPGQRVGYGLVYDALRARTVLFSGYAAPAQPDDTWEWDGTNWQNRGPTNKPKGRSGQAMSYNWLRGGVLLYGGWDGAITSETWSYGTAQRASFTTSGTACAGSAGQATLAIVPGKLPWLGDTIETTVSKVPNNGPVAMFLGFSNSTWGSFSLPLPLAGAGAGGCQLYASIDLVTVAQTSGDTARWGLPLPNTASLAGLDFYLQAFVFDAPANALGAVFSDLGTAKTGRR